MPDRHMIAVIGTGVVGACVGYHLAREGAEVMLVDAGHPGRLTTNASFAWVNASSKADNPVYFDLNAAGLAEYDHLLDGSLRGAWWHPTGHVRWDYADEAELVDRVQRVRARGYPAEIWEAGRVRRTLEPNVRFDSPAAPVAVFPSEAWIDGPSMVDELVAAAVANGATTAFGARVCRITVDDGTVRAIALADGRMHRVEAVVNAAGWAAAAVAALVGRQLPMKDRPGLAVRVQTRGDLLGRVIHAPGIAVRPDGRTRSFLLARGVEPTLRQGTRTPTDIAETVKRIAAAVVPELGAAPVIDARVGRRPITGDGLPAIGNPGNVRGYYEAVTHSGITLGPILGRLLTAEMLHGHIDPLVARFRASRL